jgi:hypothetical protein
VVVWVLVGLVVAALAAAAWIGVRGWLAYRHLQTARTAVATAVAADGAPSSTADAIRVAGRESRAAHELTTDPIWRAGEAVPWIGPQLTAVSTLAAAGDELAASTLEPVAELATTFSLDTLRPREGVLDLAAFAALQDVTERAAEGLTAASRRVEGVDRDALLRPVRTAFEDAATQLETAAATATTLQRTTRLLPAMLGADGARRWLLLVQNSAELRSLGGMPGANAVITADNGRLTLSGQDDAGIPRFDPPVTELSPQLRALYTTRPARWFSGTTILPDFADAAPIAREMWLREHGVAADGVVSIDPIALSYLLEATGPLALSTGETLTSANAVDVLLNRVYFDYPDPVEQNAVFADATAVVFRALANGAADPARLVAALGRAADERRLLLWSTDPAEQALLAETTLSGHLPVTDADASRFGIYLNDGTASKLGYYLDAQPEIAWETCPARDASADSGEGLVTLTLTLRSDAPAGGLPISIAGGAYSVPAGVLRVVTYIYLPPSATLLDATVTGAPGIGGGMHGDYRVLQFSTDLAPGGTAAATVTVALPAGSASTAVADITPAFGVTSVSAPCSG